jgi:hypothetical protein
VVTVDRRLEVGVGLVEGVAVAEERQVEEIGCAVAAQTADIVPADGALYALRDATATVPRKRLYGSMPKSQASGSGASKMWARTAVTRAMASSQGPAILDTLVLTIRPALTRLFNAQ